MKTNLYITLVCCLITAISTYFATVNLNLAIISFGVLTLVALLSYNGGLDDGEERNPKSED
jgi:hypothetical protein